MNKSDKNVLQIEHMEHDFVNRDSIVKRIWGDTELILLIFAGAAAEFALNKAVDWLFFTNQLPSDPVGRLFSTVRYARDIIFASEETALKTLNRINTIHVSAELQRGQTIPDWAYRDVLYMLIDYSERAHQLLYRQLSDSEQEELYSVFRRVGEKLNITCLPTNYQKWKIDRQRHLDEDLVYSDYTKRLFEQYRRNLGIWRYEILLQGQATLVPQKVRRLLRMDSPTLLEYFLPLYGVVDLFGLQSIVRLLLIQPQYWNEIQILDKRSEFDS